jgi:hypothetical protein
MFKLWDHIKSRENKVKVGSDFQRLPSKHQILTTKVNLSADQENIRVKVEGDSQE